MIDADRHHVRHEPRSRATEWGQRYREQELPSGHGIAWCGATLEGWHFLDASHAALSSQNQDQQIPCPSCVAAIVEVFLPSMVKTFNTFLPSIIATLEMAEKTLADLPEIGTRDAYKLASMVRATLVLVKP